jgi:hypothetical protein
MFGALQSGIKSGREIEALLHEVLVPVEPSARFVRGLRARLVHYRGDRLGSIWMGMAVIGTALLILVALSTFALRLAIAILGALEILSRRRRGGGSIRLRAT